MKSKMRHISWIVIVNLIIVFIVDLKKNRVKIKLIIVSFLSVSELFINTEHFTGRRRISAFVFDVFAKSWVHVQRTGVFNIPAGI